MINISWKELYPDLDDSDFSWYLPENLKNSPSQDWLHWLLDAGSLTSRLQEMSEGQFHVKVIDESWNIADPGQLDALDISPGDNVWSRRVLLTGNHQPWVVAHTSIPESSFEGPLKKVMQLNEKPLGELLFTETSMTRGPIFVCKTKTGWGRRSKFYLYGQQLTVAEYFLDSFISQASGVA